MCRSDNWGDCRRPRGNLNAKAADSPGRFSTTIFTVLFHCFPEQMAGNRRVATFFKKYQCHCCLLKNLTVNSSLQLCPCKRENLCDPDVLCQGCWWQERPSGEGHKYKDAEDLFTFAYNELFSL